MLSNAWWWLFGGAFLDALIGPNLIVPGEPFLIAAGYQLYSGSIIGLLSVFIGGWIGDQLSYVIGRHLGSRGRRVLGKKIPKTRRPMAKARIVLKRRGNTMVAVARLLGPVAWIMPFLAGSYKMPWRQFTLYSLIGLTIGVGQFAVVGYFLAQGVEIMPSLDAILLFIKEHAVMLSALAISIVMTVYLWRKKVRRAWLGITMCWIASLGGANYFHYFISNAYAFSPAVDTQPVNMEQLSYEVYPGLSPVYEAQPINVVFIGENPDALMSDLGWQKNETFSGDEITFKRYIELLENQTPPISDLYWQQQPQWSAYQKKGDLLKRQHIRWWYAGQDHQTEQPIWVGSVSYDDSLKLAHYKGMLTILHSIDPDIDEERDKLADAAKKGNWQVDFKRYGEPEAYSSFDHYFSDGQVAIIQ